VCQRNSKRTDVAALEGGRQRSCAAGSLEALLQQRQHALAKLGELGRRALTAEKVAAQLGLELLGEVFAEPTFVPQPDGATYAEKITGADRDIDWSRSPEETINQIRALSPHIGARGLVEGRRLIVWKARPAREDSLLVADGVEVLEVQREGGKRMTAEEYLRGRR
jgi:methionyl-tRNA formyltransferase